MSNKKKILLLSDDLRLHSGIATMSRAIVLNTIHKYDWVQVGAGINHPEVGKILDISQDIKNLTKIDDASLRIIPWNGYGDPSLIRQLLEVEKPDAILHFTDPRYWVWLYQIEHEIRQQCPILYYTIWDDVPDPLWNRNYYESCDWLGCISKQTYGIVKRIGELESNTRKKFEDWQVSYVPHGIDSDVFKPVSVSDEFKKRMLGDKDYNFIVFWSNRNIRRKQPADVILAYKQFCDSLPKDAADKCLLLMHTAAVDENGTDLNAVKDAICPDYDVKFSQGKLLAEDLNYLYNLADVTVNIAGNEGFGLTTAESVMAGTPIAVNVTGGLQDQCGFKNKETGKYFTPDDYINIKTLHNKKEWSNKVTWGKWVYPIWSVAHKLNGSVPTPYIFDDMVNVDDLSDAISYWYNMSKESRKECGIEGRNWMINEGGLEVKNMAQGIIDGIETTLNNWNPRQKWSLYKIS
jgi:glycosyltransferase involved in cell wall biosynthesis